ncbi:RNA polymerase sigma factor [Fluviicola taffensis]|uniref:RNA polymerase, sigma-24 subunit, ECF subfamily n=1 Tax=Fluviicola taffensis (strain DSM 16823 / NCIMB 13979 / RW262) TaxID=755732 RepID=F2IK35_FLUTR|nr:RNA polymerase sigma factor [Fluviicola taffensis]AEA42934.1 RNA polymerase, sigma-24 subunit, ECF subfamily [Fluviicola taffensis DSM 16823]
MSTLEFNNALIQLENYLRAFAMTYTKNEEDAKDLTQETILKAITYRESYTPQSNFKAWVFTIMKNTFINQYRRKSKTGSIFDSNFEVAYSNIPASSSYHPYNHILKLELEKHIGALSEEFKLPFELHHAGYKYQEIAEKMNVPIGTIKSRIFIARKKLSAVLEQTTIANY